MTRIRALTLVTLLVALRFFQLMIPVCCAADQQ